MDVPLPDAVETPGHDGAAAEKQGDGRPHTDALGHIAPDIDRRVATGGRNVLSRDAWRRLWRAGEARRGSHVGRVDPGCCVLEQYVPRYYGATFRIVSTL